MHDTNDLLFEPGQCKLENISREKFQDIINVCHSKYCNYANKPDMLNKKKVKYKEKGVGSDFFDIVKAHIIFLA